MNPKILDEMLGNPVTTNNIISIFGESQTGKTTLALQIARQMVQDTKRPACIYDTEGGIGDFLKYKKYDKELYHVWTDRIMTNILYDHGFDVTLQIQGNMVIKRNNIHEESQIMARAKKNNYCCIIYDSYSTPFKVFGAQEANLPARTDAHWLWNNEIFNLQEKIGCAIIQLHHASKRPVTKPGEIVRAKMIGGNAVQYASKYIISLEMAPNSDNRIIQSVRHPNYPPYTLRDVIKMTNDGFVSA